VAGPTHSSPFYQADFTYRNEGPSENKISKFLKSDFKEILRSFFILFLKYRWADHFQDMGSSNGSFVNNIRYCKIILIFLDYKTSF
jgi:hypothetical protein